MTDKPKIAPGDYNLLYVRINAIYDVYNERTEQMERTFKMEHVAARFAPNDHIWSHDKDSVSHCYRELEQGQYYLIFAHRVQELTEKKRSGKTFGRWVWRFALPMSEKQIRLAYQFYTKNSSNPKLCAQYADSLVNPKITPAISEFEYD